MAVLPVAFVFIVAGFHIITVISISTNVITGVEGAASTIKKPPGSSAPGRFFSRAFQ
jgi:hypothetical protein